MLHWVGIEGGESYRRCPLMVLLVNKLVHLLMVQHPVGVVKHDLLHQQTDNQLCQDPVEGWENPGGKERMYKSWTEKWY